MLTINDFLKVELKVGTILEAEELLGSEKLIKILVDLGPSTGSGQERDIRQVLAGIKKWYTPERLVGRQVVIAANLEPRMMMGYKSDGMVLAVGDGKPILLKPAAKVKNGSVVR